MTAINRLKELRDYLINHNLIKNKAEFDEKIQSRGYISSAERQGGKKIGSDILNRVEKAFPFVNVLWLMTGEGSMFKQKDLGPFEGMDTAYIHANLPVSAGDIEQVQDFDEEPTGIIKMKNLHGAKHFFQVVGCSMLPKIKPGDWIGITGDIGINGIIDPDKVYFIITRDNQRMIKHIAEIDREKQTITCVSDNPEFKPFKIEFADICQIYQVVFHTELI